MVRTLALVSLLLGLLTAVWHGGSGQHVNAQTGEVFYYRKGEKIPLKVDPTKLFVLFKPETTKEDVLEAGKPVKAILMRFDEVKPPTGLNLTQEPPAKTAKWAIIDKTNVEAEPFDQPAMAKNLLYKAPFFVTPEKKQVGISHLLYVKLKMLSDKPKLEALAKELKVDVVGNNKQMPLWFTLACTKESVGNALQVANKIVETKLFAEAAPDFLANFQLQCADDEHFGKQWGLKNTGQNGWTAGIDIGVCEAWKTATGKGVKVAVVDHGIQLDHPDLQANISPASFDTVTGKSPSQVRGNHGTACAGIVAACRGNGKLGVSGVAPGATLISVSDNLTLAPGAQQNLASGLAWAWQNGADVISNSWGHDLLESPLIDDAIEDALTKGRGGKGCVVVFAAGNNDGTIIYPARAHPGVLVVGAMSPCGQRKNPLSCDLEAWWGSCFGGALDVVAPGVKVPTTDRTGSDGYDSGDYALTFNGTSSATPCVAGVAALILEVNPNFTQEQVVTLIEKCARKVGPYTYAATAGRPNGEWHQEMGYGLVDAKACVQAAVTLQPKKP